jgi:hypothetical protein
MKSLQQLFAFSLLFALLAGLFHYLIFTSSLNSEKEGLRTELLSSAQIHTEILEIPSQDLFKDGNGMIWHHHNKEIELKGHFYEVVKIQSGTDKTIIYLVSDEKEDGIINSYYDSGKKDSDALCNIVKLFFNLYSQDFCSPSVVVDNSENTQRMPFSEKLFSSDFLSKIAKPPRFIS